MDTREIKDIVKHQGDNKPPYIHRAEREAKRAMHDCKPRGGSKGTHNRWTCKVCGKHFSPSRTARP